MNIIWYGQSCFKIQSKDAVLFTDPFGKEIGLKPPSSFGDIVLISHNHFDHNNYKAIKGDPFVIDKAGEYEIKKVFIAGIDSYHDNKEGKERGQNVIYTIEMENVKMCHLGDFGQENLTDNQLEKIGQIDILFVPIGGCFTIDWKTAVSIINQIEPRIIIPMHYKINGLSNSLSSLDTVDNFCGNYGISAEDAVDKITVKEKNLPHDETKIIVMKIAS